MFVYLLISITIGVEGGIEQPVLGFENIHNKNIFSLQLSQDAGIIAFTFGAYGAFYEGRNPGYSINEYGGYFGFARVGWRISPNVALGIGYDQRKLQNNTETGLNMNYSAGLIIRFKYELLSISPAILYDGVTDFAAHAGFLGIRLGIAYEL